MVFYKPYLHISITLTLNTDGVQLTITEYYFLFSVC
ncbi:hypothetical protein VSVS05_04008 [Vibrio scophthalmi]|uniref:Uncharacterized protein n=1 Tax=Vibrio scophthalmi TaxID=45658 RepID=A0A1C7FI74_9VIBR|nr:hypothetical protein VSVS05_04008 [Vibrio scophthalmi]